MIKHYANGDYAREDILTFVTKHLEEHGYAPSYREIGEEVGLKSTSSVHSHIKTMLKEGMLETDTEPMEPRALRVPGYEFSKKLESLSMEEQIKVSALLNELKDLKAKNTPLKPKGIQPGIQISPTHPREKNGFCVKCGTVVRSIDKYCSECGQAQKWEEINL